MMRPSTAIRIMPAIWLAIPLILLAAWYVTLLPTSEGYAVDATAKATMTLAFVGAFCGGCAAWEGSRLRRGGIWNGPTVRSRTEITVRSLLPVFVAGLIAVMTAIEAQLLRSGAVIPDARITAVAALDVATYAVAGFALGVLLPFAVAGPLAIAGPLIWIAFVPAIYPVWLRHVTGMFRDCCGVAQDIALSPLIASTVLDLGMIAAGAILLIGPLRISHRLAGAAAAAGLPAALAVVLVAGMPFAPVVPRDLGALMCQSVDGLTLCLWPEHEDARTRLAGIATQAHAGWRDAGIAAPSLFTEADPAVSPTGALSFWIREDDGPDAVVGAFVAGMLPPVPDCPGGFTGGIAFQYLAAWYATTAGLTPSALQQQYGFELKPFPPILPLVSELAAATSQERLDWTARAREVSQACDDWPVDRLAVRP